MKRLHKTGKNGVFTDVAAYSAFTILGGTSRLSSLRRG